MAADMVNHPPHYTAPPTPELCAQCGGSGKVDAPGGAIVHMALGRDLAYRPCPACTQPTPEPCAKCGGTRTVWEGEELGVRGLGTDCPACTPPTPSEEAP